MPIHDWTRVDDGIFHSHHHLWSGKLVEALNGGILPPDFYSLAEAVVVGGSPDVLTLREPEDDGTAPGAAGLALLTAPPQTRLVTQAARRNYTRYQRRLVIRHVSGDRIIAMIEIVSSGNKSGVAPWTSFVNKAMAALNQGVHLLVVDLYPPTPRDPSGVHGAVWGELTGEPYSQPAGADRTLASYFAGVPETAYVEPVSIGQALRDMPLFLTPDGGYIEVPLESTYQDAYRSVPRRYRDALEAPG